ncbi:MAG: hypothetical protein HZB81_03920, partial [Deltaproteobacteria bacterium]|nr:hypothetical protein [Deltaproteobacteria bacterium]
QGAINAGGYVITPSGQTSGNYTITYANGTLTVNPAALTVTAQTNTKTYDGLTGAAAAPVVTGTIYGADTAGFSETYDNQNAGTGKTLTASGIVNDGNSGNNYTYTFLTDTTGVINTAALTVTANADSKTYNGLAYSGGNGVTYTGLVNSETSSVLGGTLAYGGTSQGATNAGSYVITPGGQTSGNYTITFVNGVLTINPTAAPTTTASYTNVIQEGLGSLAAGGQINYYESAFGTVSAFADSSVFGFTAGGLQPLITYYPVYNANRQCQLVDNVIMCN